MTGTIRIAISGNSDYTNSSEFLDFMDRLLSRYRKVYIKTGDQSGAELLARAYNRSNVREVYVIDETDYKPKGITREYLLTKNVDLVALVWDGVDKSVFNTMVEATIKKIPVKVLSY